MNTDGFIIWANKLQTNTKHCLLRCCWPSKDFTGVPEQLYGRQDLLELKNVKDRLVGLACEYARQVNTNTVGR